MYLTRTNLEHSETAFPSDTYFFRSSGATLMALSDTNEVVECLLSAMKHAWR